MEKLVIGRKRNGNVTSKSARVDVSSYKTGAFADTVFVFGAVTACVMLALPMFADTRENAYRDEVAVAVMSTAVNAETGEREEVMAPSSSAPDEWSFYDYIGELFAGLLSGKG